MTKPIQVHSKVGRDGVLRIPLTEADADADVVVTIEPLGSPHDSREDWQTFLERTYGSCAGLGMEEPGELPFEDREPVE